LQKTKQNKKNIQTRKYKKDKNKQTNKKTRKNIQRKKYKKDKKQKHTNEKI